MASQSDEIQRGLWSLSGRVGSLLLALAVLLAPAPPGMEPAAQRLAAVTLLMAILWLTQAIPVAATSLIPLLAFPLLGIQPARTVSAAYINDNSFLYLGGFVIALGIERWDLHRRLALHIVYLIGASPRRMVLGFMVATGFLSMWISNTASTLLMLPIGLAMLRSLREYSVPAAAAESHHGHDRLAVAVMLGIAYAASIGGMMTLVGTPTNITFLQIWKTQFPSAPTISAGQWMTTWVPYGVVFLLLAWSVLVFRMPPLAGSENFDRRFFRKQLDALGPPRRAEVQMLVVFAVTAALWIFRTPLQIGREPLLPGWSSLMVKWLSRWNIPAEQAAGYVNDSTVAMGMALLLFWLPAGKDDDGHTRYLMDWKTAERLPWGILLLFGGGFALADAFRTTGLSEWIGGQFAAIVAGQHPVILVGGVCLVLTFLTEFTTNVATCAAVLPILAGAAISLDIDPRLLMIPAAVSTSCAFMLPIATPPNAIVFGSEQVRMGQMVRYGIWLNLLGVVLTTAATFILLVPQQGIEFSGLPGWANPAP